MGDGDAKKGFKVNDKRRVDEAGQDRSVPPLSSDVATAKCGSETMKIIEEQAAQMDANGGSDISFSTFVMSLGTQALLQLGAIDAPPGVEVPIDRSAAQQTIEILAMMQNKTKGNLDKDEDYLIGEILHNLRMAFIQAKDAKK